MLKMHIKRHIGAIESFIYTYKLTPSISMIFLSLLTFLTYLPSLFYSFHFDDREQIIKDFSLRSGSLGQFIGTSPRWISKWLNSLYYAIAECNPWIYRLMGISTHLLTGIILFILIYKICSQYHHASIQKRSLFIASLTSGLFLLHPLQTQTVTYVIQGQLEGLSALFSLVTLLLFWGYTSSSSRFTQISCAVGLLASICIGTGTKEIFIIIPALMLLVDWFFIAQGSLKNVLCRWWLYTIVGGLLFTCYTYFSHLQTFGLPNQLVNNFGNALTTEPSVIISRGQFFISQFKVIVHYLWLCIWPYHMSVEYDWKMVSSFFSAECLMPLALLCCIGLYTLFSLVRNRTSLVAFGLLWFFICILPRASIIPSTELVADYKTYLASVGIYFIMALAITHVLKIAEVAGTYLLISLFMCGAGLLSYASYTRNLVWQTEETFWADVIQKAPGKARGHNNYGTALQDIGKYKESCSYFKKACSLDAKYPDPWINLSVSYKELNKLDKAIICIEKALVLNPYQPESYLNYGLYLLLQEQTEKAQQAFLKAIALRPHYGKAWFNLARSHAQQNDFQEAYKAAKHAATKTDFIQWQSILLWAKMAYELKDYNEAIIAYTKLLILEPQSMDTAVQLAQCYVLEKRYEDAYKLYQHIVNTVDTHPLIWFNTGECAYKLHHYAHAITCFERAISLLPDMPQALLRLAQSYMKQGDLDAGKLLLEKLAYGYYPKDIRIKAKKRL